LVWAFFFFFLNLRKKKREGVSEFFFFFFFFFLALFFRVFLFIYLFKNNLLPLTLEHPSVFVDFHSSCVQWPVASDHAGFEKSTREHSAAQALKASVHER